MMPLPWRPLAHLDGGADALPLAFAVSAYHDLRLTYHGFASQVAIILPTQRNINTSGWRCLLRLSHPRKGPGAGAAAPEVTAEQPGRYSPLTVRYTLASGSRGGRSRVAGATGFCDLPESLSPSVAGGSCGTLHATVVNATDGSAPPPGAWLAVEEQPAVPEASRHDYATGQGRLAVCTPPLHTDAFAASIVAWTEFHRLVGASKFFIYSFNPGPFTRPVLDYYSSRGTYETFEWILPNSILKDANQECKLPWFHPSASRRRFGSFGCTYHQDNYNVEWWGQIVAIQDCVYRAMGRYRWVAVMDLDEYLVPRGPDKIPALLARLPRSRGRLRAEYGFSGFKVCSGCPQALKPDVAADAGVLRPSLDVCRRPSVGMHHILWSSVMTRPDHFKSMVDPLSVLNAAVHRGSTPYKPRVPFAGSGIALVPEDAAVKLHDRMHNVHANSTFASEMLPLLKSSLDSILRAPFSAQSPVFDCRRRCAECSVPPGKPSALITVDYTMCNVHGRGLTARVQEVLRDMELAGVFEVWRKLDHAQANVYGGFTFAQWG